jgi:hypothetical protein
MEFRTETLMDPPFAKDPPVKLNISAKTLGLVYAILGGIAALFGLFGLLALFGFGTLAGAAAILPGIFWLAALGAIISEIGTVISAWGGYQMYQLRRDGKRVAVYGIVINAVGGLVSSLGTGGIFGWVIGLCIAFVLYYLVIISRFPDEPPLVRPMST